MRRLVLLALLLGQTALAWAQTTGHIEGVVLDREGHPLDGVTVTLVGNMTSGTPTVTDERGQFRFVALHPGSYTVWSEEHGPRAVWRSVAVSSGMTSKVSLTLSVGQAPAECPFDDLLVSAPDQSVTSTSATQGL
jgi:iron complex outermembrane receptor protein